MKTTTEHDYRNRIVKVLDYIQDHLDEPLNLDTVAEVASFSPFHFHRIFRVMVGETLADHIRRERLQSAAQALRQGGTVLSVALDNGYESPEAFSRAFKSLYGISPNAYAQASPPPEPKAVKHNLLRSPNGVLLLLPNSIRRLNMNVDIVTLDDIPIAFVPHRGSYDAIHEAFQRIIGWASLKGFMRDDTLTLGRYYDDPDSVTESALRSEACVAVPDGIEASDGVELGTMSGGTYAKVVYKGPYENMKEAYDFIYGSWMPESGRDAEDRPCVEFYLNSPEDTAPEDLIAEIYIPLKS